MDLSMFPKINASLNAASGIFLVLGYFFIRRRAIKPHIVMMTCACLTSVLFLSCYLYYHYHHGSTKYTGQGIWRTVYFTVLISHTILAVVIVPMVLKTVTRGIGNRLAAHVSIGRKTLPLWLYVSVTGVVIYAMLYGFK